LPKKEVEGFHFCLQISQYFIWFFKGIFGVKMDESYKGKNAKILQNKNKIE
jgi:hypothetical protein